MLHACFCGHGPSNSEAFCGQLGTNTRAWYYVVCTLLVVMGIGECLNQECEKHSMVIIITIRMQRCSGSKEYFLKFNQRLEQESFIL